MMQPNVNMNAQPGLGIIPTLFGLQQGAGERIAVQCSPSGWQCCVQGANTPAHYGALLAARPREQQCGWCVCACAFTLLSLAHALASTVCACADSSRAHLLTWRPQARRGTPSH